LWFASLLISDQPRPTDQIERRSWAREAQWIKIDFARDVNGFRSGSAKVDATRIKHAYVEVFYSPSGQEEEPIFCCDAFLGDKEIKRGEPGATDNPDDAQRLREDH
jgi:hypothetical protein